jgi:hypothetical protein
MKAKRSITSLVQNPFFAMQQKGESDPNALERWKQENNRQIYLNEKRAEKRARVRLASLIIIVMLSLLGSLIYFSHQSEVKEKERYHKQQ